MKRAVWLSGLLLALSIGVPASRGQERPNFVSPEISADHHVTYRIAAPNTAQVQLVGPPGPAPPAGSTASTANPGNWVMPMQKGADGIWSLTVGPLAPDVYRYNFVLDGVRALT